MRKAKISRETAETKVYAEIRLDGKGIAEIDTGIGFLDHMLTLMSRHGRIDMRVICKGDLAVDGHHTVEDTGIAIGRAIGEALGEKKGIRRYGSARIPMDESLAAADIDISGRPFLAFSAAIPSRKVGEFDTSLTEEFFRALAQNAMITLHLRCEYGKNSHHIIEGLFKAFGRALAEAAEIDPRFADEIPSTKGVL